MLPAPGPGNSATQPDEPDTKAGLVGVTFTYSVANYYLDATPGSSMSGWAVASVIGGLFALVILGLLVVVSRAVMRTARNAGELMVALEQVQAQTMVLADLEAQSGDTARVADQAAAALHDLRLDERVAEHEGNRRDGER